MGEFGEEQLPTTSYGYQPPREATAFGWECSDREGCGGWDGEGELFAKNQRIMRGWPKQCTRCGKPADPRFNDPWAHEAEGAKLHWRVSHGANHLRGDWEVWQFRDGVQRGDAVAVAEARARLRQFAAQAQGSEIYDVFGPIVTYARQAGDLDGAAADLLLWIEHPPESQHFQIVNFRVLLDAAYELLRAEGASARPWARDVRARIRRLAEDFASRGEPFTSELAGRRGEIVARLAQGL